MRLLAIVIAGSCLGVSIAAANPSADELQRHGEGLAQSGQFSEAIDAFKAADRIQPTASHMCLIALAYTRRELWPQAEIHLELCRKRATTADPLPDWFGEAEKQMAQRLAEANVAPVEIVVEPADAKVQLTVSSFAPDERFEPRTIHLPPGHHVIIATAPGYQEVQQAVETHDRTPKRIVIHLRRPAPPHAAEDPLRRKLIIGGAITFGAGVVSYAVMGVCWFKVRDASNSGNAAQYDRWDLPYRITKYGTLGLWGVGAGLAITGLLLHRDHHEDAPVATIVPTTGGGGMVVVGWQH